MPIWRDAIGIAENIFSLTKTLPKREDFGLTAQIRRSSFSVAANIAEAFGRSQAKDKISFCYYARGSLTETQSHLEYAIRVEYIDETSGDDLNQRPRSKQSHRFNQITLNATSSTVISTLTSNLNLHSSKTLLPAQTILQETIALQTE
ncbi:MAG: four helix bundle protein [Bacteroidota bacterium]